MAHKSAWGEYEAMVVGGFAYDIHRCAFALGDTFYQGDVFSIDDEAHSFWLSLPMISLAERWGRLRADAHVNCAAGGFNEFRGR